MNDVDRVNERDATIAALQARVQELEQWVQDQSTANLETMRHTDEMQSRAMEAEQQLTQRTAELEAATRKVDLAEKKAWLAAHDVGFFSMWNGTDYSGPPKLALLCNDTFAWATADCEDVLDEQIDTIVELFKSEGEAGVIKWIAQQRNMKPMESVGKWLFGCDAIKKERDDLQAELERVRALIKALPKVEGAVVVSNGYVKDSTRCHALFGADEDAALYAALLQHRQGMEGVNE